MSATLWVQRSLNALRPADAISAELLERLPTREDLRAEVFRPRNAKFHRKLFALLNAIFPHQSRYATREDLRVAVEIAIGFGHEIALPNGKAIIVPKSISFAKLDQAGFDDLYERAVELIVTRILPGVGRDDLNREVAEIMAGYGREPATLARQAVGA